MYSLSLDLRLRLLWGCPIWDSFSDMRLPDLDALFLCTFDDCEFDGLPAFLTADEELDSVCDDCKCDFDVLLPFLATDGPSFTLLVSIGLLTRPAACEGRPLPNAEEAV